MHLDWMYSKEMYALVLYLGEGWTDGKLEFPQLGVSIPTRPSTLDRKMILLGLGLN